MEDEETNRPEDQGEEKGEQESSASDELENALKEQKAKNLLLLAEMENARKRMQKEKHDTTRFAVENVISEFLSPLDNLENALGFIHQASNEVQTWAKGFEMIMTQFKDILSSHSVTPFKSKGMALDPHMHEVIEVEETEMHTEGTIIQEFVRGYKCGDRVLRPAKVKVAKQPAKEAEEKQIKEEEK